MCRRVLWVGISATILNQHRCDNTQFHGFMNLETLNAPSWKRGDSVRCPSTRSTATEEVDSWGGFFSNVAGASGCM